MGLAPAARQGFPRSLFELRQGGPPFGLDARERHFRGPGPGNDDQVYPRGQEIRPEPEALAAEAPDAVALHGPADLAARYDAQPGRRR
jgi:hypothetical protein